MEAQLDYDIQSHPDIMGGYSTLFNSDGADA
jgi:hypothetical protein